MDVSKLEVGMRVKNYRVLCELLGEKVKTGEAKILQVEDMGRYFDYKKDGISFIIQEIHSTPSKRVDRRKETNKYGNNRKEFKQFKIPLELENRRGVYKITQGKNIYIGSTFRNKGFRARFRQHLYKTNKTYTRDMLLKGGKFEILWMCPENLEDEYVVRKIEEDFIKYFKENTTLNVMNKKEDTNIARGKAGKKKVKKDKAPRYKKIRVNEKDYERVLEFMKLNNIDFK